MCKENLKLFVAGYYDCDREFIYEGIDGEPGEVAHEHSVFSEIGLYTIEEVLKLAAVQGVIEYFKENYEELDEKTWEELSFEEKAKYIYDYCEDDEIFGLQYFDNEEEAKKSYDKWQEQIKSVNDSIDKGEWVLSHQDQNKKGKFIDVYVFDSICDEE